LDKAPDAFRTISEVADDLDVPQHVLRFWETRFTQIKPMKRSGGRRYYRPDDVNLLRGIRRLLYGEGYTIRGVQRILREQGSNRSKVSQTLLPITPEPCSTARHSLRKERRHPDLAELEIATEDEVGSDEPATDEQEDEIPASPLSLRDLGPPLSEMRPPKVVVAKPVSPAPVNGSSGAEAYAPPNIRKNARPMDRGKLQAALDDLIGRAR
jgi:DNA-binding transcriptional MerR regulator